MQARCDLAGGTWPDVSNTMELFAGDASFALVGKFFLGESKNVHVF